MTDTPFFEVGEIVRVVAGEFNPVTGEGSHMFPEGRDAEITEILDHSVFEVDPGNWFYAIVPDKFEGKNADLEEGMIQVVHEEEIRSVVDFVEGDE